MIITYSHNREEMRKGTRAFYNHRHQHHLFPVLLALMALLFGIQFFILDHNRDLRALSTALLVFAIAMQWKNHRNIAKTVENAFQAYPNERIITIVAEEDSITISDGENSATNSWSCLVDFKHCKTGLLIYPQKEIFQWIPDSAEVDGGTWQDFNNLISSKIVRKR